jgi:hypothetical protein
VLYRWDYFGHWSCSATLEVSSHRFVARTASRPRKNDALDEDAATGMGTSDTTQECSVTRWLNRWFAVFCGGSSFARQNLYFFGEAPERRPWAIKRERSPGRFCRALQMVLSSRPSRIPSRAYTDEYPIPAFSRHRALRQRQTREISRRKA